MDEPSAIDVFRWLVEEHRQTRLVSIPPVISDVLEYLLMSVADLAAKLDALVVGDTSAYAAQIANLKQQLATVEANDEAAMSQLETDVNALHASVAAETAAETPAPAPAPAPADASAPPAEPAPAPADASTPVSAAAPAEPAPAGTLTADVQTGPAPEAPTA